MFRTAAAFMLITLVSVIPVSAAGADSDSIAASAETAETHVARLATDTDWSVPAVHIGSGVGRSRGALLPSLYVSLAALNLYDAYTTRTGLNQGAIESNPATRGLVGSSAGFLAVKAAATATSIFLAERLWRQHRRGEAVAVMVISNGMMAAVAARNSSVLHGAQ
jgi:hypothetical protein